MRSTFAGLNTMYRGINTSQLSLDTVGHNITNANTEGYSRQRVNLVTTRSQTVYGFYGGSQVGSGVDASSITRARDVFADKQYWRESSNTEYASAKQQTFDKIEAIFDDSDDSGIQNAMNEFWQSWKSLSTNASDYSARVVVRDKGKSLSDKIQQGTSQLQDLIEDNNSKLELKISTVNQLTKQIAELNDEIFTTENVGGTANDLRDSRDLMVDKLSALVNVSVYEKGNGTYSISSDGNLLVDGSSHTDLATVSTPNKEYGTRDVKVVFQKTGATFDIQNGELRGIQDSVKESKRYIDDMARMSAYLLTDFNAQHQSGFGMNDESGVNFFGKDGTINANNGGSILYQYDADSKTVKVTDKATGRVTGTLNSIQMIQELNVNARFDVTDGATGSKGTDLIAAKAKSSTDPNKEDAASGNNALLLGEAINVTNSKMLGNVPLSGYYTGMMGGLGVDAQTIDRTMTNQENIMLQTNNWRGSVSGVNWNEELTNMIKFQQGYSSCSRCLTTMDEMLDKLINSTGTVGR